MAILRAGDSVFDVSLATPLGSGSRTCGTSPVVTSNRVRPLSRRSSGSSHEELGITIEAPAGAPDLVLNLEEESVRLSVWFIDYSGPVENRCPEEHDDVRWLSIDEAARLSLADPAYVSLIRSALRRSTAS